MQQNQNRNTPPPTNRIEGFHSSLLTALREDTDEDDDDLVFNASKLGMVASPTKAWADECDSDDTFGADMGGDAGGDESDSPTSPLGAPRASSRAATDIRVLLGQRQLQARGGSQEPGGDEPDVEAQAGLDVRREGREDADGEPGRRTGHPQAPPPGELRIRVEPVRD
jgi:hypothetical protein